MKTLGIITASMLLLSVLPVFGAYVEPSTQEQDLYSSLRAEFEKLSISKRDVSDALDSFSEPIIIAFPCDAGSLYNNVEASIQTKLAKFDDSLSHTEGAITGGIYVWKCNITISGGKMTINCNNELMLNSAALLKSSEKDPEVKKVEDLVILYHELLHGQLMIEAIKSNDSWRDNTCNNPINEDLDYSYTDADHAIITPLQTEFASRLIKEIGGTFQVEEITPEETSSGSFSKRIGSLYDYPAYVKNGINISARSYNVAQIQIASDKNDIIISGILNDKTRNGIVWLYVFGKPAPDQASQGEPTQPQKPGAEPIEIPPWVRSNAMWWADGTIGDSDFVQGITFLIENNIMVIPQTSQGAARSTEIPYWIKNNAKWWADGMISDSDFVLGIQFLIKNGIMYVAQPQVQPPAAVSGGSAENLGYVKVSGETFERQRYQQTLAQITGEIEDFKTGTYVILTINRPDQTSFDLKGMLTNRGMFTVPLSIDINYPEGRYAIIANYNGVEVGTTSFVVR